MCRDSMFREGRAGFLQREGLFPSAYTPTSDKQPSSKGMSGSCVYQQMAPNTPVGTKVVASCVSPFHPPYPLSSTSSSLGGACPFRSQAESHIKQFVSVSRFLEDQTVCSGAGLEGSFDLYFSLCLL